MSLAALIASIPLESCGRDCNGNDRRGPSLGTCGAATFGRFATSLKVICRARRADADSTIHAFEGQHGREPAARPVLEPDIAPVRAGDRAGDGKAQPGAPGVARS